VAAYGTPLQLFSKNGSAAGLSQRPNTRECLA
jgi:hypothetical protein